MFTPFSVKTADINIKAINYPIKFEDFENNISKIFSIDKYIYLNLELKFDNTLNNINNNKQVHLTEIESKIIKLLFNKLNVDKKLLNKQKSKSKKLLTSREKMEKTLGKAGWRVGTGKKFDSRKSGGRTRRLRGGRRRRR